MTQLVSFQTKILMKKKKGIYKKVAIKNVDINALGLYTLGELRKSTDKDLLSKYQVSFEKYFKKFNFKII